MWNPGRALPALAVSILVLATRATAAPAQQSVPEILTWIGSHFETPEFSMVVEFSTDSIDMDNEKLQTSITFQGCKVAITQVETDQYTKIDTGLFDYSLVQTGTATLDLATARPDQVTAGKGSQDQPPAHLIIKFARPFAWHQEQKYSAHPVPQDLVNTSDISLVEIDFATLDMANRQAKAWRDAIVACGGKAAPADLAVK